MRPRLFAPVILLGALSASALSPGCAARSVQAVMADGEAIAGDAEQLLRDAEQALAQLDADKAEKYITKAQKKLSDEDVAWYPEREELRARAKSFAERLPAVRAARAKRDHEEALQAQRRKLEGPSFNAKFSLARLEAIDVHESDIDKADDAQEDLEDALDDGKALERSDVIYGGEAMTHHKLLTSLYSAIQLAKRRLEFVDGPARMHREGFALLATSRRERDSRKLRDTLADAREALDSCSKKGRAIIASAPAVRVRPLLVDGQVRTPAALLNACETSLRQTETSIRKLDKRIAVADARASRKPRPKPRR